MIHGRGNQCFPAQLERKAIPANAPGTPNAPKQANLNLGENNVKRNPVLREGFWRVFCLEEFVVARFCNSPLTDGRKPPGTSRSFGLD